MTESILARTAENLRAGVQVLLDLEEGRYVPSAHGSKKEVIRRFLLEALEADLDVLDDCVREQERAEPDQPAQEGVSAAEGDPNIRRRVIDVKI